MCAAPPGAWGVMRPGDAFGPNKRGWACAEPSHRRLLGALCVQRTHLAPSSERSGRRALPAGGLRTYPRGARRQRLRGPPFLSSAAAGECPPPLPPPAPAARIPTKSVELVVFLLGCADPRRSPRGVG